MIETRDLLIEIGTEELPPKSLLTLAAAFAEGIVAGLVAVGLSPAAHRVYATPRRLAVVVDSVPVLQAGSETERLGPALAAAFDSAGAPTKAAEGFARSCGVAVGDLQQRETDKGTWLVYTVKQPGRPVSVLLEGIIAQSLAKLPIPKRMRWGAGDVEFVRPVHWVCVVLGEATVDCQVLGLSASNTTRGHRFHANHAITVDCAGNYSEILLAQGKVIADFARRRTVISEQIEACAHALNGQAMVAPGLLEEVTALVEWPVAISGGFEDKYLSVPEEVLITTLQDNQKYFPLRDTDGKLLPAFITVSNIDSDNPASVREGNQRVVRPRLADAMFFWEQDRKQSLAARSAALASVLFQKQLGSLADKVARVTALAEWITTAIGGDLSITRRAAVLSRCDLLTDMVGEFPSLQGVMGEYYARHDGEPAAVAVALREQYLPKFASDVLASSDAGRALAIAERIDTLVGIFAIGQRPSGVKDPFALRRAALGVLRTCIECELGIDLRALLAQAAAQFSGQTNSDDAASAVFDFMMERLKAYYANKAVAPQVFDAVIARQPGIPLDFDRRIHAVRSFSALPQAASLSAANKRIRNILKKAHIGTSDDDADGHDLGSDSMVVDPSLLQVSQERDLYAAISGYSTQLAPLLAAADYTAALTVLSALREPVDAFFDAVMVMAEDPMIRANRLALLRDLAELLGPVADISRLDGL